MPLLQNAVRYRSDVKVHLFSSKIMYTLHHRGPFHMCPALQHLFSYHKENHCSPFIVIVHENQISETGTQKRCAYLEMSR